MIPTPTPSTTRIGLITAIVIFALAATALAASAPTDAWITTKVKISLVTSEGVRASKVNVDTMDRMVILHGTVGTAAEKQQAERIAKSVEGAHGVRNLLQVVPAGVEAAVEEKDDAIHTQVSTALGAEVSLKRSTISVQSVNKGVVLLKGKAATLSDQLTALQLAASVKGVRRVASEIESDDALADAEVWKERNIAVGGTSPQGVRSAANDLYITSMVKMRLLANAETPAMDINVDTRVGVVTLFGMVPTDQSKLAAEAEAGKTGGVVSVSNLLQVMPHAGQPAIDAKDDVVQDAVSKRLKQRSALEEVRSEVTNCVARLTGSVASGADRVEAMQVARSTRGVCSVSQDILIR